MLPHDAVSAGSNDIVKLLLDNGADADVVWHRKPCKITPLHLACELGHFDIAVLLLEGGANPNVNPMARGPGRTDGTPLHVACELGRLDIAALLLERGANPDATNVYLETPLHLACENGANSEVVKMLANSNPETCLAKTSKGSTPLDLAYMHNANKTVVETLVQTCMVLAENSEKERRTYKALICLGFAC